MSSAAALEVFAGAETVDEENQLASVEEEAGVGTVRCGWSLLDARFRRCQYSTMARLSMRTPPAPPPAAAAMGKLEELEDCGFVKDSGFDATITGSERTVSPRAADALAAVPMLLERRLETAAAVMFEGTLITPVIATEAPRTEMLCL